jgi:hypothetical protein
MIIKILIPLFMVYVQKETFYHNTTFCDVLNQKDIIKLRQSYHCNLLIDVTTINRLLKDLHGFYLRNNEHDEGDLLFYRINYKLIDCFGITQDDAEKFHLKYHYHHPRRVSEGYCHTCKKITSIIPIIYGVLERDLSSLKVAEDDKRLIVGNLDDVKKWNKVATFGCKICMSPLPKYGTI